MGYYPYKYRYDSTILQLASRDKKIKVTLPQDVETRELFEAFEVLFFGMGYTQKEFEMALLNFMDERGLLEQRESLETVEDTSIDLNDLV